MSKRKRASSGGRRLGTRQKTKMNENTHLKGLPTSQPFLCTKKKVEGLVNDYSRGKKGSVKLLSGADIRGEGVLGSIKKNCEECEARTERVDIPRS